MYWIIKKRKYDPAPYSRLLRMWHKLIGCPVNHLDVHFEHYYNSVKVRHVSCVCPCGNAWVYE